MQESELDGFGWSARARNSVKRLRRQGHGLGRGRWLRFEPLEDRRMLSVLFVDDDAVGGGNGAAWGTAFDDLQPALEAAAAFNSDAVAENDVTQIWIAEGTYAPSTPLEQGDTRSVSFSLVDGVTLYGGFDGTETALSERDLSEHETVLSGDIGTLDDFADNAYTVVYCGQDVVAAVDGVTVMRGNANGDYSSDRRERYYGGAIYNVGDLTVVDCQVLGNRGTRSGGVCNESVLSITNSIIAGNHASFEAGGLFSSSSSTELYIANVTIAGNAMSNGRRTGLEVNGNATIVNSIICLNEGEEAVLSDWNPANVTNNLIGIDPGFVRNPSSGADGVWGTSDDDYGDLHLGKQSPAIDLGSTPALPGDVTDSDGDGDTVEAVPVDLDGDARTFGGTVDIGAYEYQGTVSPNRETPSLTVTTGDDEFDLYDGDITLREAVYYAGIVDMGTTITFDSSLDGGTILLEGDAIELRSSLTLDASALDTLTIDGGGSSRVFNVGGYANGNAELIGLTVTGGKTSFGGGILNEAGVLTITDCVIRDGEAYDGGGIYNSGNLIVVDSLVSENRGRGAGIYNTGSLTVSNSTISENTGGAEGGGIYSSGTLEVTDSTVSNNRSGTGGGIAGSSTMTVTNSTISDNIADSIWRRGGGIAIENGTLTVTNSTVSSNTAEWDGGGIYAEDSDVHINGSSITGNSATRNGGGVYVKGTLSVTNSIVSDNTASDGGGLWCWGTLTVSDSTLSGNTLQGESSYTAKGGGAIFCGGDLTVTRSDFCFNSIAGYSWDGSGAGIYAGAALTIVECTFSNNRAGSCGGAVYASGPVTIIGSEFFGNTAGSGGACCGGLATVVNSFFGGNTARYGGALDLYADSTIVNSAFVGNRASQDGGAIYGFGEWTISNSTFTQNTAGYGEYGTYTGQGGIYTYGTANITNSLFWKNGGGDLAGSGEFVVTQSLIGIDPQFNENPSDGGDGWGDDPDTTGVDESANDDYGDLRLTASSPAVDAGRSDLLAADVADLDGDGDTEEPIPYDFDGAARIYGDSPDAGAYELQADPTAGRETPSVVVTTNSDVSDFYDGEISLREAIWHAGTDGLGTRITFDSSLDGATIVLDGTELLIDKTCAIDALSLGSLTVDADGRSGVFHVLGEEDLSVGLIGLTITGGDCSHGGGLYNHGEDTVVAGCTFFDNSASTGGGLYNLGTLTVVNSVFLANEGSGAVSNHGRLTLSSSTFVCNNSPSGFGAVGNWSEDSLQIDNSLFWQNEGGDIGGEGMICVTNSLIGADPQFVAEPSPGPDQEWGTQDDELGDLRLTDVSPAVDGGDSSLLPADSADLDGDGDTSEPIPFDRAGAARIQGDAVDVGAYEFGAAPAAGRETASLTVTTAEDVFDPYDGVISLREAIWYANGLGPDATVRFDSALDEATLLLSGTELAVQEGLTIDASDLTSFTVDAGYGSRVFLNFQHEAVCTLNGLTVIRGREDYNGGAILSYGPLALTNSTVAGNLSKRNGGAIYAAASLSISDSILSDNEANSNGGAVWAEGPVTILDSTVSGNNAYFDGGGVYSTGPLTIEDSTLCGNSTDAGIGGAIRATGTLSVLNSTIADNIADEHGGGIGASGETTIRNTTLTRNASGIRYGGRGGAIWFAGDLTVADSVISDNTCTETGGGISGGGVLTLINSSVTGNSSGYGGGGAYLSGAVAAVTNSIFAGNAAEDNGGGIGIRESEVVITNTVLVANTAQEGGGIYADHDNDEHASLTLSNCTLTANIATDSGGGVYTKDPNVIAIDNTIIAGNTAETDDPDLSSHYNTLSGSCNLIGDGASQYVFKNGQNGNIVGTPSVPIDPLFVRAPSDGGDGWGDDPDTPDVDESANDDYGDLRLAPGSPGIDHGSRAALPADAFDLDADGDVDEPLPVDLAGEERVQSVRVDIGAYEYVVDPDLGADGIVGSADLDIIRSNWGEHVTPGDLSKGDVSGDGVVNSTDLDIIRMHFGETVPAAVAATDAVFAAEPDLGGSSTPEPTLTTPEPTLTATGPILTTPDTATRNTHGALAALTNAAWQRKTFDKADSSDTADRASRTAALLAFLER